jgi:hypothetical protein
MSEKYNSICTPEPCRILYGKKNGSFSERNCRSRTSFRDRTGGGVKVPDKIKVINNFLEKADSMLRVAALAESFFTVKGNTTGKSIVEVDKIQVETDAIRKAREIRAKSLLPADHIVTSS